MVVNIEIPINHFTNDYEMLNLVSRAKRVSQILINTLLFME